MKKQEKLSIKSTYSDALFWAMSPQSKSKPYHLTRVNESVLRKLIHYSKKDNRITYSNELIAKHIFLSEDQIEKVIPKLHKKGFINCITHALRDDDFNIVKRRTININWNYIQSVLDEIPEIELTANPEEANEQTIQPEESIMSTSQNDSSNDEVVPNHSVTLNIEPAFNPHEYLTQRKLDFAKQFEDDKFTIDFLYTCDKENLDIFFYFHDKVWKIKTLEENKEDLWENINGINLYYSGSGSRLTLFILDQNDTRKESFQLNWTDFNNYLESKGIKFGDLTYDNFITLQQFEKEPLKL